MKKIILAITLFFAVFYQSQAWAFVRVNSLYVAEVPIASRSQADWAQAIKQAWLQVLVKVSGNENIATLPNIEDAVSKARSNVQRYYYTSHQIADKKVSYLHVQFDQQAVKQALRDNNQAIWQEKRPLTLIWLAMELPSGITLVTGDTQDPMAPFLRQQALDRGIPVLLPIMDLQGLAAITPKDVFRLDSVMIDQASKRYEADDVLAGKLYQNYTGVWQGNWVFSIGDEFVRWQTQGSTPQANIQAGVGDMANALASRYATLQGKALQATLILRISHVKGLNDYAEVVKYLRGLQPVTKVDLIEVDGQTLVLDVTVMGGTEALNKSLARGKKLFAESSEDTKALYYSWGIKPNTNEMQAWQYN